MNCIFDASSLLNLVNGDAFAVVLRIPGLLARVGPQVRGECISIRSQLDIELAAGRIVLLDDTLLPSTTFLSLLTQYELGAGETECLAFATLGDDIVCCDDGRARRMISEEIGSKRVTGSFGLLASAVHHELVSDVLAFASYQQMRRLGGFLPDFSIEDLRAAVETLSDR